MHMLAAGNPVRARLGGESMPVSLGAANCTHCLLVFPTLLVLASGCAGQLQALMDEKKALEVAVENSSSASAAAKAQISQLEAAGEQVG